VQIGCNDLQGADLSRRLLHGSVPNQALSVRLRWVQRLDNLQAPSFVVAHRKIKIVGQECPTHTVCGSHPSTALRASSFAKNAKDGAPSYGGMGAHLRARVPVAPLSRVIHPPRIVIHPLISSPPRLATVYQMLTFGDESNWPTARYA
jgi:hypothetical protein